MPQPHLGICRFAPISRGPAIDRTGRAVLLLISLTFVAAGCNNSPPPAPPVVPKIPAAKLPPGILPGSGHARMLHELDRIQSGERPNVFIKEIQHRRQLEEQLAGLPANASGAERVKLQMDLGQCELELGHEAEALEFMQAAQKTLKDLGVYMPPQEQVAMLYKLGVAYLRLGETENCCLRHTPESCFMPIRGQGVHTKKHGSTEAARCFTQLLAMEPEGTSFFVAAKWLLNVAHMTLGQFPDAVPEKYRIPPTVFESSVEFPHFNNIANEMGLETFDQAGGSISEDFDNDGYLEIVTSTESPSESMRLYRRNADGTFSEKTAQAMLKGIRGGRNMCQIDYDNDGDFDIYLSRGGWWGPDGMHPNSLLRNEGDGTFSDVTYESGLGERQLPTSTSSWADFDNDGDLDLFVANEAIRNGPPNLRDIACELFRNNGDGTFTNVAATAGVENFGFAKGAAWGDYNGDRLPDLYVANHQESNRLYRNLGQGRFEDVASDAHVRDPIQAFPCWFWDYNNDGNLDLMVHAYPTTVDLVASHYLGLPTTCDVPSLYRGDGQGNFEDVAEEVGITRPDMVMGCNFGDLNNDGWLDCYLGTGRPGYDTLVPNVMYLNRGGKRFDDVSFAGGFANLQKGHGVSFADFDQDGDQDVFEQVGGSFLADRFTNLMFENPGFGNHWIQIELVGVESNRSGQGARIRVEVIENGQPRSIFKHVTTGGSFGCNPHRQHIGLGTAEKIVRLEIEWPTTGQTQVFEDISVDRDCRVIEGHSELLERDLLPIPFVQNAAMARQPNPPLR